MLARACRDGDTRKPARKRMHEHVKHTFALCKYVRIVFVQCECRREGRKETGEDKRERERPVINASAESGE